MKPDAAGAPASYDPSSMAEVNNWVSMMGPYFAVAAIIGLAVFVFYIFVWWKIFSKAGYSGALALLNLCVLIPFIGWIVPLVLTIWFAFADWPVRKGLTVNNPGPVKT
jgi:uncharacterized membrane protein YhaH (DUF805 family)